MEELKYPITRLATANDEACGFLLRGHSRRKRRRGGAEVGGENDLVIRLPISAPPHPRHHIG